MWDRRIHQLSDKRLLVAPKEIPYNEAKLISSLLSWGFRFFLSIQFTWKLYSKEIFYIVFSDVRTKP